MKFMDREDLPDEASEKEETGYGCVLVATARSSELTSVASPAPPTHADELALDSCSNQLEYAKTGRSACKGAKPCKVRLVLCRRDWEVEAEVERSGGGDPELDLTSFSTAGVGRAGLADRQGRSQIRSQS